jgi:hypothetical protein
VVVGIGVALALGAFTIDQYVSANRAPAMVVAAVPAGSPADNDDEIYTGSILSMPDNGHICRQWLFNNLNGELTDNGYVDCARAAYHSSLDTPKLWSAARVRVISTGFRSR